MIEALTARLHRLQRLVLPPVIEPGAMPWASLTYLVFLAMPFFIRDFPAADVRLTLISVLVFLPIYFAFYWVRGWRRIGLLMAMAALSVALLPSNLFANSFIIYSNVMAGFLSLRRMLAVLLVTQGVYGAALWTIHPHDSAGYFFGVNLFTSTLASLCNRIYIAKARQNQVLRLSQEEVQRLARVAERERIGRDLHDLLGHTLSVVALKAELAVKLFHRDPDSARREMADVERVAREALGQVRRAVAGMRALGIRAEFANARLALAAVEVDFEYRADDLRLHPETETTLALALREATTNIIRHAGARRCRADLLRIDSSVALTIRDDGVGGVAAPGNGLAGMRERIEALGGSLAVTSSSGTGTELAIRVPYREVPEPEARSDDHGAPARRLVAVK